MKKIVLASLLLSTLLASTVTSAGVVDVVDALSPASNANPNYFVPGGAQPFDIPYFRYTGQDWGWKHNAILGTYATATLSISAYDVDNPSSVSGIDNEIDEIYGWETSTSSWDLIGTLAGSTDTYSFTTFNLGSSWADEISSGLMVSILIDQLDTVYWGVSLAKSVIATDGEGPGDPNPGAEVPVPAAAWLFGSALLGFVGFRRKML